MKYLSLFTGIGGFEKGIEQAYEILNMGRITGSSDTKNGRHQPLSNISNGDGRRTNPMCVGFSEIDKYAVQTYQKHYPNHKNYGDITKIKERELPDFDILVGGFPCQSFSIAGKRGGFADTRGTLFFDIARILGEKQPRLFLLENVKGLLSHDDGRTFRTIIATLDELGYDLQWQVLNSKNFGVPQNRERVLIVGHLRGTPRPKVFPIIGTSGKNIEQINNTRHDYDRVYSENGISPTINTGQRGNAQPKIVAQRGRYNAKGKTEQQLEPRKDNISNTLTSVEKDNMVSIDTRIRRLTPIECERLQGFPDNWTAGVSDTQRYKQCGNAVTVNVIQAVIERML